MTKIKRSLAIVIGINEYSHIPKLNNAVSDAQELANVLQEKYRYKVLPLLNEEASKEKLDDLLGNLERRIILFKGEELQVEQSDRLLFYFAGHGFAEEAQESEEGKPAGYFMPQNAEDGNPSTWLSMQKVYQAFTNLDCHHLLMILDCCFAGRISWVVKGRNAARPRKLYQQSYDRFIKHRTEQIITSAAHDEKAQDSYRFGRRGEKNGHSPFAHLLLKVLKGNADGSRDKFIEAILEDKVITVHELFTYLQNQLGKVAEGQTPALSQLRKYDPQTREYVFLKGEYIFPLPSFDPQDLIHLDLDENTNPYKGLASFETEDSQLFFGRKRLIEGSKAPNDPEYIQDGLLLKVRKHSLTVVLGVSGSGKSSLVKAGLIPALKSEKLANQEQWYVLNPIQPGEVPITALARAILPIKNINLVTQLNRVNFLDNILNSKTKQERELGLNDEEKKEKFNILVKAWKGASPEAKLLLVVDYFEQLKKLCSDSEKQQLKNLKKDISNTLKPLIEELKKDSQSLTAIVKQWNPTNQKSKLLLVIDQCEELITLCSENQKGGEFLKLLAEALDSKELSEKLHIVLTLRSEFEPQIRDLNKDKYKDKDWQKAWQKLWQDGRFKVTPMDREELQQVIEEPAAQRALFFESPKLVNDLIDEVIQMPGALPLLSFTLSELYLKYLRAEENGDRNDRTITEADYQEIGGVIRSLTETADKTYNELINKEKVDSSTIRDVMLRMVAISGGELARRRVPTSELVYPEPKNEQAKKVIKAFYQKRLLIKGLDAEGQEYVEPVHDALATGWDKLLIWKKEEEPNLILQRRLNPAAKEWNSVKNKYKEQPKVILDKIDPVLDWLDRGLFTVENLFSKIAAQLALVLRHSQHQQDSLREKPVQFLWNSNPYLEVLDQETHEEDNWLNEVESEFVQASVVQKRRNVSWRWRIAGFVMLGLSLLTIFAFNQRNQAVEGRKEIEKKNQGIQLDLSGLKALQQFEDTKKNESLEIDALLSAIKSGRDLQDYIKQNNIQELQNYPAVSPLLALQTILDNIRERNRITSKDKLTPEFSQKKLSKCAKSDQNFPMPRERWSIEQRVISPDCLQMIVVSSDDNYGDGRFKTILELWKNTGEEWRRDCDYNGQRCWLIGKLNMPWIGEENNLQFITSQTPNLHAYVTSSQDNEYFATKEDRVSNLIQFWRFPSNINLQESTEPASEWNKPLFLKSGAYSAVLETREATEDEDFETRITPEWDWDELQPATLSPNGKLIIVADHYQQIGLFDSQSGKQLQYWHQKNKFNTVFFTSDSQNLVVVDDNSMRITQNLSNQPLSTILDEPLATISGNPNWFVSASVSPDGQLIATGGADYTVRLWDLKGRQLAQLELLEPQTYDKIYWITVNYNDYPNVSFSQDGKYILIDDSSVPGQLPLKQWKVEELDDLLKRGCNWLSDYLRTHNDSDRDLCDGIKTSELLEPTQKISIGEKILVPTLWSPEKQAGVKAISNGDFATAIKQLEAYLKNTPNDPEALIYLNNARIGNRKSYTIAISAPIGSDVNGALEMLRGVAQAQNKINQEGDINQVPLGILIADDNNKPDTAKKIAEELVKNPNVMGVVGHYASDVTLATGKVYEARKLAAVSPVSSSVKLTGFGKYIFRTVPNDSVAAKALADYMLNHLGKKNAAVFYNSQSGDSKSLKSEFVKFLSEGGGQISSNLVFNLSAPNFDAAQSVEQSIKNGAEVLVLLPNTEKLDDTLRVVEANKKRLPLLGSDDVYTSKTLEVGADADGMIVAVPWHILTSQPDFRDNSRQLWKADVNWRTAMSYDATMALITGLEQNPTREGLAKILRSKDFTAKGATGEVKFNKSGDRTPQSGSLQDREIQLVEIKDKGTKSRSGFGYDFELVP